MATANSGNPALGGEALQRLDNVEVVVVDKPALVWTAGQPCPLGKWLSTPILTG